jgi:hypothetical protein
VISWLIGLIISIRSCSLYSSEKFLSCGSIE